MLRRLFYFFILSKKIISKPRKKKILIFDSDDSERILKYFKKKSVEILDFRMAYQAGQKLNLYVLFLILAKFKLSMKSYFEEYIRIVDPKAIITLTDNYPIFYSLKMNSDKTKKIIIQKSFRTLMPQDVLSKIKMLKKNKNNYCDFLLMFNFEIGKIFKSFLRGKVVPIGSFKSNSHPKFKGKKKIDILYISTFRKIREKDEQLKKQELIFFNNLKEYCLRKKTRIHVLGSTNYSIEKTFYTNVFDEVMVEFISRYEKRQTYKIVDSANITLSIDSTLGYESAGRGNKVGFFCIREKTFPFSSFRFGWPVKKNYKGLFWTDKSSLSEISRVINFLHKKNYSTKKKVIHKELKNIIAFDEGNKKFLSLIKKLDI